MPRIGWGQSIEDLTELFAKGDEESEQSMLPADTPAHQIPATQLAPPTFNPLPQTETRGDNTSGRSQTIQLTDPTTV
eukprot:1981614-Rhodomonas_salina.1